MRHLHTATFQVSSLLQDFNKNSSVTTYIRFLMNQIKTLSVLSSNVASVKSKFVDPEQKVEFDDDDDETGNSSSKNEQPIWAVEALYSIVKNSRVFRQSGGFPVLAECVFTKRSS